MSGLVDILGRMGWNVPEGWEPLNVSHCRRCTHEILWCQGYAGRRPLNRDGSRHPMDCRVSINSVRRFDQGRGLLRACRYCGDASVRYNERDIVLHIRAQHPIARTLAIHGA